MVEENTGPLTMEGRLLLNLKYGITLKINYEYFSLPYEERAWFTSAEKSYSYHKIKTGIVRAF